MAKGQVPALHKGLGMALAGGDLPAPGEGRIQHKWRCTQETYPGNKEEKLNGDGDGAASWAPAAIRVLWEQTGLGAGTSPSTGSSTAGQMLLHPMTCWEHPAMWPPNQKRLKSLSTRSSYGGHVSTTEGAGEWGAGFCLEGMGQLPVGWTSSRATSQMPDLTGGKGTGMLNAAFTLPCGSLPAQPLCSHHGTFSLSRILSWQRMGNDESSLPQPHPARPKESSSAFEVAFKGSRNEE